MAGEQGESDDVGRKSGPNLFWFQTRRGGIFLAPGLGPLTKSHYTSQHQA